jgi:hypothetical protein
MRKVVGAAVLIFFGIGIWLVIQPDQQNISPQPTIIIQEKNDDEDQKAKQDWYEQMHRTAPGEDWRQIDNQSRFQLRQQRTEIRRLKTDDNEVIADGLLTGKWIEKGANNIAGRMHNIDFDFNNNLMYGASDGGQIWKADLGGTNWQSLTDHYHVKGVHFLRIVPLDNGSIRILQINRDSLMMYSDNNGLDWKISDGLSDMKNDNCVRGVSDGSDNIYLLFLRNNSRSLIYKSSNKGQSFDLITSVSSSRYVDIWTSRYDDHKLYFIDREQLYSINENNEIQDIGPVGINFSASEIQSIQLNACLVNDTANLAVMYRLDKTCRFVFSKDNGQSWSVKGTVNEGPFMSNSFGMSTLDPSIMGFGGVNAYRSVDSGNTWQLINAWGEYYGDVVSKLHADIPEVEFFRKPDGQEIVVVSTDGGSYISQDYLQSVKNISLQTLRNSQYYSTYTHRENTQVIYAGSQDQGFQRTTQVTDGVANFEQTISGDYGHISSSDGGRSFWTVYPGFAMYYPDAVGSNQAYMWSFTGENHFWMPPIMEDPYYPDRAYLAGGTSTDGNHLWYLEYKSNQISVSELPYNFGGSNGSRISAMAYSPINKDYRYVLNSSGKLYYSTDRGVNWVQSRTYGPGSHYFYGNSIIPDPRDINTIYIGGSGYSGYPVWKSTDGGRLFKGIGRGIPKTLVFEMAIDERGQLLFAATEVGPFVYIVSEDQWYDLAGAGAPEQTYWSVDYVPALRTARFGTYGRGIWDFKIEHFGKIGTSVDDELWVNHLGLEMYPNPVDRELNIKYYLENQGDVDLMLLDGAGRIVKSESYSDQYSGANQVQLDLGDLPKGLYFLRIQSGDHLRIEKIIKQ